MLTVLFCFKKATLGRSLVRLFLTLVPRLRTLRKAREQILTMVNDGISTQRISGYLHRWAWPISILSAKPERTFSRAARPDEEEGQIYNHNSNNLVEVYL